jgi:thiosulfate/3-mercaptopyruvate sulfurtransferase
VEREGGPYLKSAADLAAAYQAAGAAPDRTMVTYCYVGYRASFSYFVGRLLGYQIRFYDGSYDDWSQRKYPTVAGVSP